MLYVLRNREETASKVGSGRPHKVVNVERERQIHESLQKLGLKRGKMGRLYHESLGTHRLRKHGRCAHLDQDMRSREVLKADERRMWTSFNRGRLGEGRGEFIQRRKKK